MAFSSVLKRANDTLDIVLKELNLNIPIHYSYKLNERHYGALQGLNKDETRKNMGKNKFIYGDVVLLLGHLYLI